MIADHKFNLYQLKQCPYLFRGNESAPYQNAIIPSGWGLGYHNYSFVYYYFFDRKASSPNPFKVSLTMHYYPDNDDLRVGLMFENHRFIGCPFEYKKLLEYGYSVERLLEDFENIFLEIPFCSYQYPSVLKQIDDYEIAEYYRRIATEYHMKMTQHKRTAIAMLTHNRLGGNSFANDIPQEILKMIGQNALPTYIPSYQELFQHM